MLLVTGDVNAKINSPKCMRCNFIYHMRIISNVFPFLLQKKRLYYYDDGCLWGSQSQHQVTVSLTKQPYWYPTNKIITTDKVVELCWKLVAVKRLVLIPGAVLFRSKKLWINNSNLDLYVYLSSLNPPKLVVILWTSLSLKNLLLNNSRKWFQREKIMGFFQCHLKIRISSFSCSVFCQMNPGTAKICQILL